MGTSGVGNLDLFWMRRALAEARKKLYALLAED